MAGTFAFPSFAALAYPATPASAAKFTATYNVLASPNLTRKQRQVLEIILGIGFAANSSYGDSRNYASNHAGLISDAKTFTGGLSNFDFRTALVVMMYLLSAASGATPSSNISTLLNSGKDFAAYSELELDRMLATLLYRSSV